MNWRLEQAASLARNENPLPNAAEVPYWERIKAEWLPLAEWAKGEIARGALIEDNDNNLNRSEGGSRIIRFLIRNHVVPLTPWNGVLPKWNRVDASNALIGYDDLPPEYMSQVYSLAEGR